MNTVDDLPRVRNTTNEIIPPFALLRVTGMNQAGEFLVAKPSRDGEFCQINGPVVILPGRQGQSMGWRWQNVIAYDMRDGTPQPGELWGAAAGQWEARRDRPGFRITGNAGLGFVNAVRFCGCDEPSDPGSGPGSGSGSGSGESGSGSGSGGSGGGGGSGSGGDGDSGMTPCAECLARLCVTRDPYSGAITGIFYQTDAGLVPVPECGTGGSGSGSGGSGGGGSGSDSGGSGSGGGGSGSDSGGSGSGGGGGGCGYCSWVWNGTQWELASNVCAPGCVCNPPTWSGSYPAEGTDTPCIPAP